MNIDYAANIAALEAAQPEWLTREDIVVKLGAPWVPASMIAQFANSLIRNAHVEVIHEPYLNTWRIELGKYAGNRNSSEALSLGAGGCSLWDLLTDCLHQRQTEVTGETADGKKFRDEGATIAARERQTELNDQFEEWAWSHPDRATLLEQIYNTRFNSHVVPTYDGSHMTFPGLSATVTPRPYQANAAWRTVTSPHSTLLPWRVGAGKALRIDQPVLTPTGYRPIGDLTVGDLVIGRDGTTCDVEGVFPQGPRPMFDVELTDGTVIVADGEHLWEVHKAGGRGVGKAIIVSTQDMIDAGLYRTSEGQAGVIRRWFLPMCSPVHFPGDEETPVDPYLLGVILGDGCLQKEAVSITSVDDEIVNSVASIVEPWGLRLVRSNVTSYRIGVVPTLALGNGWSADDAVADLAESHAQTRAEYVDWWRSERAQGRQRVSADSFGRIFGVRSFVEALDAQTDGTLRSKAKRKGTIKGNPLLRSLRGMGLDDQHSYNKFIPHAYKFGSIDTRIAMLQGLFDTDGYAPGDGTVEYCTTSPLLAQDVKFIAETLGGTVTIGTKLPRYPHKGTTNTGRLAYRVLVKLPQSIVPFRLSRKVAALGVGQRPPYRAVKSIKPAGIADAVCIKVSAPDSLFLTTNCTPTHNTLGASMAVQELRRLGHIRKAMIVVPNHMLDGWAREYMQAYPTAKLLMATREMTTGAERQRFAAMCATGNWDAIVITESGFGRIPLSPRTQARHLADTLGALDEAIAACEASWSVKRLERTRKRLEAKHKALLSADTKDVGVTFEQLGVDFLVIDELHRYKNLEIVSVIRGVASTGTQRAEDLMAKMSWLRRQHPGRPVALGLTATPISNAVAEMHTITRFVAPEVLDDAGVGPFDAWAATFAQTVNLFEMTPEGDGYRVVERFARFHNVPEMANMYRRFADVLDAADTADGRPDTERILHEIKPGDQMTAYMGHLIERARLVRNRRVSKDVDNLLAITTSGRLAAVDPRLVGVNADPENKLTAVADKIADTYHATADTDYGTSTPGGFQLVFCDLGTPSRKGWNCYTELAELLTARGVNAGHIEFIHDHKTDADKGRLFNACRNGNVRILIGSTETCGIGMNVQTRLTDLHHVNPPWKPAEVEQRDGRGPRPGNLNKTVRIHTYITVGSFDAYSWTILTRKAGFLAQLAAGSTAQRTLDVLDVDDRVLSYEEIKAIASGNPLVLRKAELDAEHHRLTRLRGQHRAAASRMRWDVQALRSAVERLKADQTALTAVVKAIDPKAGFVVAGDMCSNETAGEAIKDAVAHGGRRHFDVRGLRVAQDARYVEFSTMTSRWQTVRRNLNGHAGRSATAAYKQILAHVDGFADELDKIGPEIERRIVEADAIEARANIDWPHHARLAELTIELAEVNQALLEAAEAA